jgi:diguanylate cyclase (GGDEF)-like protein
VAPSGLAALVAAPLRSARPEARLLQGAFLVEYTTPPAGASLALEGEMELIRIFADNAATAIDNDMMVREIERMAVTDDLTGLYNRRYFNQELEREIVRSERTGKPFALLMADLDDFKRINDTYGHDAGDDVLRKVAQSMVAATRKSNLLARYGGEEFVSLLIESDAEGGLAAAERTRRAVEQIPGLPCRVTVSVGVAVFPQHARTMRELFRRADQALYAAKSTGRNQVRLAAAASHASATST